MDDKLYDLLDLMLDKVANRDKEESDYYYNEFKVPRVTKIIQRCIHNDGLMYWANSLGFKGQSYAKTLSKAAEIGTQCHNNIDQFLTDHSHTAPPNIFEEARNAYNSFLSWFEEVNKYVTVKMLMHEESLVCKYFGGTLDGLYQIDGKIYIVDYKTSNHVTYNYCLQLAAYIIMLEKLRNIKVDGCIVLQLSKTSVSYNECMIDFRKEEERLYMEECKTAFLSMVLWYYNLGRVEDGFDHLDWK